MILVCGASGFVGRHVVSQLSQDGHKVRCLIRNSAKAGVLSELNVEFVEGDITKPQSLNAAFKDIDTVVHLVGIIVESGQATYQKIHVEGTSNLVAAAKAAGVKKFVYVSALGTREQANSRYHQTKFTAEQTVVGSGLNYTIFRPSLMYGVGGEFINMLLKMIKAPIVPIVGSGKNLMQPLYVGDLAICISKSVNLKDAQNQIFEIAGPDPMSYESLLRLVMKAANRSPLPIKIPFFFVKPQVMLMEMFLAKPPLTSDQLIMLKEDSVCDPEPARQVLDLNLTKMEIWLTENIKEFN